MKNVIIVDIDGTIAKIDHRLQHIKVQPKNWDKFYAACEQDEPIEEIINMVYSLSKQDYRIVFCTGRKESVRERTEKWIEKNFPKDFEYDELVMRDNNDYRPDHQAKPFKLISKDYIEDIAFVLEDRDQMVNVWRLLGFICLQVVDGNY